VIGDGRAHGLGLDGSPIVHPYVRTAPDRTLVHVPAAGHVWRLAMPEGATTALRSVVGRREERGAPEGAKESLRNNFPLLLWSTACADGSKSGTNSLTSPKWSIR